MELGKAFVIASDTRQRTLSIREERCRALGIVAAVDAAGRVLQALGELFGILQQLAPRLERVVLAGLEVGPGNFLDLILERFHAAELLALVHAQSVNLVTERKDTLVFFTVFI